MGRFDTEELPEGGWVVRAESQPEGRAQPAAFEIAAFPAGDPDDLNLERLPLGERICREIRGCEWTLEVSTVFGPQPLFDFHLQLRVLAALAPDLVAVLDLPACAVRPGDWVRDAAACAVPPEPASLHTLHLVYEEEAGHARVWMHTHGLRRCGSPELEALGVARKDAGLVAQLINCVAALFLDRGTPAPDEAFAAGRGLPVVWLPWEQGVRKLPAETPGADPKRDEDHAGPSAMLFTPGRWLFWKRYRPLSALVPVLQDNPVLYLSDMETARMAMLARERLGLLRALHRTWGASADWRFLVKLGYPTAQGGETSREHLWFDVHDLDEEHADATLINQPYDVPALAEGDRGRHPLRLLSDWCIFCPRGRFDPSRAPELLREGPTPESLN